MERQIHHQQLLSELLIQPNCQGGLRVWSWVHNRPDGFSTLINLIKVNYENINMLRTLHIRAQNTRKNWLVGGSLTFQVKTQEWVVARGCSYHPSPETPRRLKQKSSQVMDRCTPSFYQTFFVSHVNEMPWPLLTNLPPKEHPRTSNYRLWHWMGPDPKTSNWFHFLPNRDCMRKTDYTFHWTEIIWGWFSVFILMSHTICDAPGRHDIQST